MDRPFLKFYVKDYAGDSKLKRCSLGAQGLWVRIMCEMHDSPIYGKLIFDQMIGKPIKKPVSFEDQSIIEYWSTCEQLSLDCVVTMSTFTPLMKELIENQVAKIDPHGNLYSYRMVKDHDISIKRSNATKSRRKSPNNQEPELFAQQESSAVNDNTHNNNSISDQSEIPAYARNNSFTVKMISPSEYMNEFMNDKMWIEPLMMSHRIREGEMKKRIAEFAEMNMQKPQLLTDGKREKEDARDHFTNWLRKMMLDSAGGNKNGMSKLKSGRIEIDGETKSHGKL